MRICILNDPLWGEPFNPQIYLEGHNCKKINVCKNRSYDILKKASKDFDVFLNFCDGSFSENRPGIDVIRYLEKIKVPFTGAVSSCYEPSRNKVNLICKKNNILTPKAIITINKDLIEEHFVDMKYPLFVKSNNSYGSLGLTRESRVDNFTELRDQVEKILKISKIARIEEFIEGKEFSCLISQNPKNIKDPISYLPIEVKFPMGESFKHEKLKWLDYKQMSCEIIKNENISNKVQEICKKLFVDLEGRGYARCDLRMDQNENIYMLEINFQAGVLGDPDQPSTADLILKNDPKGYKTFIDLLLRSAFVNNKY